MATFFGLYIGRDRSFWSGYMFTDHPYILFCNTEDPNFAVVHFQTTARSFGLYIVYNRDDSNVAVVRFLIKKKQKGAGVPSKQLHGGGQNDFFVFFKLKVFYISTGSCYHTFVTISFHQAS